MSETPDQVPERPRAIRFRPRQPRGVPPAPAAPQGDAPEEAKTERGVPLWFQLPLWIALVVWLGFLAYRLLDPAAYFFPADPTGRSFGYGRPRPVERVRTVQAPVALPEAPVPVEEPAELKALKLNVAARLLACEYAAARGLIDRQRAAPDVYPYQDKLMALRRFVQDVAAMDRVVREAFHAKIDHEVLLRYKGKSFSVIPRAMAGDRINVLVKGGPRGERTNEVTFAVADLDPVERAHWIGEADTPDKCAMKCILHALQGDHATAKVFAEGSGPLAEALEATLASAPPTTEPSATEPES